MQGGFGSAGHFEVLRPAPLAPQLPASWRRSAFVHRNSRCPAAFTSYQLHIHPLWSKPSCPSRRSSAWTPSSSAQSQVSGSEGQYTPHTGFAEPAKPQGSDLPAAPAYLTDQPRQQAPLQPQSQGPASPSEAFLQPHGAVGAATAHQRAAAASLFNDDTSTTGRSTAETAPPKSRVQLAFGIASFALPLATQNILGYSLNALSESLVGRLGPTSLSASTLANSSYALAGLSLVWGGAAGMETLCGQAFGAGNLRLMRLVLIRAVLVCWCLCVPVVTMWKYAAEPLLLALGQSPTLVVQSAVYLQALAPSMFFYVLSDCLQVFLVVQGKTRPTTAAKAAVTVLGPLYYYTLMFWMDMGLVGAGYAYALCKATNAALLLGYIVWEGLQGQRAGAGQTQAQTQQQEGAVTTAVAALGGDGTGGAAVITATSTNISTSSNSSNGSTSSNGSHIDSASTSTSSSNSNSSSSNGSETPTKLNVQDLLRGGGVGSRSGGSGSGDVHANGNRAGLHSRSGGHRYGNNRNAHEEVLTSPFSAAATAHEFDLTAAATAAAAMAEGPASGAETGGNGVSHSAAAAARSTNAFMTAAAEAAQAHGGGSGGLSDRLRGAMAAVRAEVAEVLDPRACLEYVRFGLPAAFMCCLEWWAYEALVIMAGWLPNADVCLGCLGICLTVGGWVYMVPQAIASAACARVSNALGAGDAVLAKRTFQAAYGLVALTQLTISACLLPNAARVAAFFCPDPAAAALTASLLPITAINTIGDGMNCVLNGILRACGRQSLGARIHLLGYWCCGLPAAYCAAFHLGLGLHGFVTAVGLSSFTQSCLVGLLICRWDWRREVANSQALLSSISSTSSMSSSVEDA